MMISIRGLQEQLLADHGIRGEWIEAGGGQKCLLVKVGDATEHGEWLEIGSLECELVNEYEKPVNTFAATIVSDGDTDSWGEWIPAGEMSDKIAREIWIRTPMAYTARGTVPLVGVRRRCM